MEQMLRNILSDNAKHLAAFEAKNFHLLQDASYRILPELWDLLVQPGWFIHLTFPPPKENVEDEGNTTTSKDGSGVPRTQYRDKVNFTVKYYRKTNTSDYEGNFQGQITYDNPVSTTY